MIDIKAKFLGGMVGSALGDAIGELSAVGHLGRSNHETQARFNAVAGIRLASDGGWVRFVAGKDTA